MQNDQTDLGDQTDQTDQTNRGGARTVKHAKLPISSFDQSVSESETIISARDTGASEKTCEEALLLKIRIFKST